MRVNDNIKRGFELVKSEKEFKLGVSIYKGKRDDDIRPVFRAVMVKRE